MMKSLKHHPQLLTRFLPGESGNILKELEDHGGQRGQNVVNASSSSNPHPSPPSQNPVMPKGGPSAMTDGPVFPPTPIAVIEVSNDDDDDVIEILDDDELPEIHDDDPPGKTFTSSDYRMILSCDGRAIPVIQVADIAATEDKQNSCVVSDLNGKLPCHLYDVQQVVKPAASSSKISHMSGAMVSDSSVDGSSSSMFLLSLVYGSSSSTSLHSSVDGSNSNTSLSFSVYCSSTSISLRSSVDRRSSVHGSTNMSLHSSVYGRSSSLSLHRSVCGSSSSMSVHSSGASSHSQPSVSGTARGSLLKSYLTSKNPQVGSGYLEQIPRAAQHMGNKVSCFIFFVGHLLKSG